MNKNNRELAKSKVLEYTKGLIRTTRIMDVMAYSMTAIGVAGAGMYAKGITDDPVFAAADVILAVSGMLALKASFDARKRLNEDSESEFGGNTREDSRVFQHNR